MSFHGMSFHGMSCVCVRTGASQKSSRAVEQALRGVSRDPGWDRGARGLRVGSPLHLQQSQYRVGQEGGMRGWAVHGGASCLRWRDCRRLLVPIHRVVVKKPLDLMTVRAMNNGDACADVSNGRGRTTSGGKSGVHVALKEEGRANAANERYFEPRASITSVWEALRDAAIRPDEHPTS